MAEGKTMLGADDVRSRLEMQRKYSSISAGYPWEDIAIRAALSYQRKAFSRFTTFRGGACILARNPDRIGGYFPASHIEVSSKKEEHAEYRALQKALEEGFTTIDFVYIALPVFEMNTMMCLECRQAFWGYNPNLTIKVINPDGSVKATKVLSETITDYQQPVDETRA